MGTRSTGYSIAVSICLRARWAAALIGSAALVGACDGGAESPSTTETAADETTTTEDPRAAIEAEVVAAYDASWQDFLRAGDPPTPDAPFLADHQIGSVLTGAKNLLGKYRAEGVALQGSYETDAKVTQLSETTAMVEDCGFDQLELIRIDDRTVVQGPDAKRDGVIADLVLDAGSWKVSKLRTDETVCAR